MTVEPEVDTLQQCGLQPVALQADGLPELETDETFERTFEQVALVVGDRQDLGTGQLHFTSSRMVWSRGTLAAGAAFRSISMHALSTDTELHDKPCIYCQLDQPAELAQASEDDIVDSHEIMLVPEDAQAVEPIFEALSAGAEANPDDVEDDQGDFFYDQDEVQAGLAMDEDAQQRLAAFEQRLQLPDAEQMANMQLQQQGGAQAENGHAHDANGHINPADAEQ